MNKAMEDAMPTILSIGAGIGVVGTAVLAARGHVRARDILNKHKAELTVKEVIQETWKEYAPAAGVGVLTIGMIFAANGMHLKKEAALTALVGVLGTQLKNMDREVVKRYGKEALDTMRHDILEREVQSKSAVISKVEKKPHNENEGVFYEPFTEQFFWSNQNDISQSLNVVNTAVAHGEPITVGDFLMDLKKKVPSIKIPDVAYEIGWYPGDDAFEWNMSYEQERRITAKFEPTLVEGWDATVIQYNVYPAEPGEDYIEVLTGNKVPYSIYSPEPGDQLDLREIDWSEGVERPVVA